MHDNSKNARPMNSEFVNLNPRPPKFMNIDIYKP